MRFLRSRFLYSQIPNVNVATTGLQNNQIGAVGEFLWFILVVVIPLANNRVILLSSLNFWGLRTCPGGIHFASGQTTCE